MKSRQVISRTLAKAIFYTERSYLFKIASFFSMLYRMVKTSWRLKFMALKLDQLEGTISVICKVDSALDCSEEDYQKYIESGLDESHLKFKEGDYPTKFVLRKALPWGLAKKVEDEKVTMQKGEMQIKMSFISEEVRCSLIDIINPPHVTESDRIVYLRGSDGGASEKLMEKLLAVGIVQDLYAARKGVMEKSSLSKPDLKKS